MKLSFEQSTTLINVGNKSVAGMLPIAVTTKLKLWSISKFVLISTLSILTMLAPVPEIEYSERPQSGLLYVYGVIA